MTDWAARYRDEDTPWDLGRPHPELVRRLEAGELGEPGRALVPGCGRGYDALALAESGWQVTALDVVGLETDALARLAELGGRFVVGDALAFAEASAFELVLDHTFFCAIAPEERARWGHMVTRALAPAGRVASLVFPVGKEPGEGPPFGMDVADLSAALGAAFTLEREEPAVATVAKRSWGQRWALFRRS